MTIGDGASSSESNSVAIGTGASSDALNFVSIGTGATSQDRNAIALRNQFQALAHSSVALGSGSVANSANTVSFGRPDSERRLTNLSNGIYASDAATIMQLRDVQTEARRGIAGAVATTSAAMPSRPGKTTVSFGIGNYKSETAFGLSMNHWVNTNNPNDSRILISASVSFSDDKEDSVFRASAGFEF